MILASRTSRLATVAVLVMATLVNGCNSWQVVGPPAPHALNGDPNTMHQVELKDGRKLYLWKAHVVADSVIGSEYPTATRYSERTVAVAVADVATVSVSRFDAGKTGMVLALVAVAYFVIGAWAVSNMDFGGGAWSSAVSVPRW